MESIDLTAPGMAKLLPPEGGAQHAYHRLRLGQTEGTFMWDRRAGVWYRAGKVLLPAQLAHEGYCYVGPVLPVAPEPMQAPPPIAADVETMTNIDGREVPAHLIPARRRLEDQTVRGLIAAAREQHDRLIAFKSTAFGDVGAFIEILAATYGVKMGGRSGGMKLHSYDGRMRVEVSSANTMAFGAELAVAKELIDECLTRWLSEGANEHLRALVMDAFHVGEGGTLAVERVLRLRQLEIRDASWERAMAAIGDALRVQQSKMYIRFYERDDPQADFKQIVMDVSRV